MTVQMSSDGSSIDFLNNPTSNFNGDNLLHHSGGEPVAGPSGYLPTPSHIDDNFDPGQPIPLTVNSANVADDAKNKKKSRDATTNPAQARTTSRKSSRKIERTKDEDKNFKRGQYANYGPALRAEIAKYASNHGNQVFEESFINTELTYFLQHKEFPHILKIKWKRKKLSLK